MFLMDKYVVDDIHDSMFHKETLKILDVLSKDSSIPHMMFYGPNGCGIKTIIKLFLKMMYSDDIEHSKPVEYDVVGSGNKVNKILVQQSNHHIVIEPNNNNFDKHLVQDIVKEYAKKIPLNVYKSKKPFKTVIINNIDNMSYYAQTSLRRTMEKYSKTCRFILWCHSLSRVIDPLKSRCVCFNLPSPATCEIFSFLFKINVIEKYNFTPNLLLHMAKKAKGNVKTALWILQGSAFGCAINSEYDKFISEIAKLIKSADLNNTIEIKKRAYNIMITNISAAKILTDLLNVMLDDDYDDDTKYFIMGQAAKYEHSIIRSRREMMHIDAFVISIMCYLHKNKKSDKS